MLRRTVCTAGYSRECTLLYPEKCDRIRLGKQVIDPAGLHSVDTAELVLPYGKDGAGTSVQKYRDNLKYLTAMEDEKAAYVVLGVESQSEVHYAMPVRDMLYDAMQYAKQVERAARSYRAEARKTAEPHRRREESRQGRVLKRLS